MTHHRSHRTAARAATTRAATLAGAALLHGAMGTASAGPLADPTRPPAALSAPGGLAAAALPHQANRDTARAIAAAQRAADPPPSLPAPAPLLVQAVQLPAARSPSVAAVALVDGRLVKAGEQIDGRTVLAIDAQGLLVKGAKGTERLWLLGEVAKQAAGSITHSQMARYQATPGTVAATDTLAVGTPAERGNPAGLTATTSIPSNTSAATTPLSLAKRTAP